MNLHLTGRVAVVSGGSSGIGLAIAERLAAEGACVCIAARDRARLDVAARRVRDRSTAASTGTSSVMAVAADMTDADAVAGVVESAVEAFGALHIAVSNVSGHVIDPGESGPHAGHFEATPVRALRAEFDQLVMSAWFLARSVMGHMRAAGWGRILNIGSRVAREPAWDLPHVLPNVARPANAALHRVLARSGAQDGITVNSILTASIATERYRNYHAWLAGEQGRTYADVVQERTQLIPVGRPGTPEEIASVAAFLCSGFAASITGQAIPVDGGVNRHLY